MDESQKEHLDSLTDELSNLIGSEELSDEDLREASYMLPLLDP